MDPLFLFGTLQHRPLLETVLGSADHIRLSSAQLPGYAVSAVADAPFPMIEARQGAQTDGLVLGGLTPGDLDRLDFYEACFDYARVKGTLADGRSVWVYLPQKGRWTASGPWQLDRWAETWGSVSVLAAEEVLSYHGRKTSAQVALMFPMIRARAWSRVNARDSRHGIHTLEGRIDIADRTRSYAKYFALDDYRLKHERFDGQMTEEVARAVFLASDAALVLPYDPKRDKVLLVEQMRMGPLARGDTHLWQLEPVAGRLDPGETPEQAARREALEEAGLTLGSLEPVAETYCSPGNSSEFYYIFVGIADLPENAAGLGGLATEHEDIRSHVLGFEELMHLCATMQICNAPLVMASYWLAHHRDRLRGTVASADR